MIKSFEYESSLSELFHGFLYGLFDGNSHLINQVAYPFPFVQLYFQQSPPVSFGGVAVRFLMKHPDKTRKRWDENGQRTAWQRCRFDFLVMSKIVDVRQTEYLTTGDGEVIVTGDGQPISIGSGADGHTSQSLGQLASDRLYAALASKDLLLDLARNGIGRITPSIPMAEQGRDFIVRRIRCLATLDFTIASEITQGIVTGDGDQIVTGDGEPIVASI